MVLGVSFGLHFGTNANSITTTERYPLMGNVILSYNHLFCQEIQAASVPINLPDDDTSKATLYLLKNLPPLTAGLKPLHYSVATYLDQFKHTDYWNFRLNKGSNTLFQLCYRYYSPDASIYTIKLYLIKGNDKQQEWISDPTNPKYALEVLDLNKQCQNISYYVQEDNTYFFSLYSPAKTGEITFSIVYQFNLTTYDISPESVIQNCSFTLNGFSNCSVSTSMSSSSISVLSLNSSTTTYDETVGIKITCVPRVWFYVVTALCSLLFIIFITTVMVASVCVAVKKANVLYLYQPIRNADNACVTTGSNSAPMTGPKATF